MKGLWNPQQRQYQWGKIQSSSSHPVDIDGEHIHLDVLTEHPTICHLVTRKSALWGSSLEAAQQRGTSLHYGLSHLNNREDIPRISKELLTSGLMAPEDARYFESVCVKIVENPLLKSYYTSDWDVYTERDILTKNGIILRPDRLLIKKDVAVLIDYKTGSPKPEDTSQLTAYAEAIEEMGLTVTQRILIYITQETINPEFI
jgi:hypothetical protein